MKHPMAVAVSAALLASGVGATAIAAPVPAFTATPAGGQTMVLDGSASICEFGPCGYHWRLADGSRLGVTIGSGPVVSYDFPAPGAQTVILKVSQHCFDGSSNWCWRTLAQTVVVPEPDPVVVPDPPADPPVVTDPPVVIDPPPAADPVAAPAPDQPGGPGEG